ncbi:MAG: hypothetical protein IKR81_09700 [Victivallales bacterium]|nr:hypothetical protein [Victivallales bacterium]
MLTIIFTAVLLFSGCQSQTTGSPQATTAPEVIPPQSQPVVRPEWFVAPLKGGCKEADEAIAYLETVFNGTEELQAKHILKAWSIVNKALTATDSAMVPDAAHAALLQEDSILLGHAFLMAVAHDKLKQGIQTRDQVEALCLATARLNSVRKDNAQRFAEWLPKLEAWEQSHDDWCGLRLFEQFRDKQPVAILPELWMMRCAPLDANLAQESIEQWRATKPLPVKLAALGKHSSNDHSPIWIMQTIEQPEVQEGMDTYVIFSAFRGRCVAFVNGTQVASFDSDEPHYFSIPLNFKDKQCNLVFFVSERTSIPFVPLPVWLATGKKTVPPKRP